MQAPVIIMPSLSMAVPVQINSDLYAPHLYGGVYVVIDGNKCSLNSVRGYTIYNMYLWNEPHRAKVEAKCREEGISLAVYVARKVAKNIASATARKEKLHWVSRCASVIADSPIENRHEGALQLRTGDVIDFDGHLFTIAPDHNRNYKLVPVETE